MACISSIGLNSYSIRVSSIEPHLKGRGSETLPALLFVFPDYIDWLKPMLHALQLGPPSFQAFYGLPCVMDADPV